MTEFASKHFVAGDRPLRRDIRLLGWLLRRLLRAHGDAGLWDPLHRLRVLAERRHEGDPAAEQAIADALRGQPVPRLASLARAVELYFDLANLAEDRHRRRVLRRRAAEGRSSETLADAAAVLKASAKDPAAIAELLDGLEVEPVLTAHPTEAKRTSVRHALRRLRRDLRRLDRAGPHRRERADVLDRMSRDLASLWYTDPISARKPTVDEELGRTLFAVRTLWRVAPRVHRRAREAFPQHADALTGRGSLLRFGNWIGGDRDGNPFVTAEVARRTLRRLRRVAIRLHRREARRLMHRLTISSARTGLPAWLKHRIDAARATWPAVGPRLDTLHPDEWLVQWLTVVDQRLRRSARGDDPMGYRDGRALIEDLNAAAAALRVAGHDELIDGALQAWLDRAATFGLHLLRLDVRLNSTTGGTAVAGLLAGVAPGYEGLDEAGKVAALSDANAEAAAALPADRLSDTTADLLDTFELLQRAAEGGDADAIGQVIVSMTHHASDALAVLWLNRVAARRLGRAEPAAIPVAPLFETIDDLHRAPAILDALMADDAWRAHAERCGGGFHCMIGYSDSAKDGGYFAANRALYGAQARLAEAAERHGVGLRVFHGRGGALGRGGGPAARAVLSLPPDAVRGKLRLTEQGEVIAERYDDPEIATRHLEQLVHATLKVATADGDAPDASVAVADRLAETSRAAYRKLVEAEGFGTYLRHCTPLSMIEGLPIGSRPSRRSGAATLDDLRAIPFTFAWNQVRVPINAFYGLGEAYAGLSDDERAAARSAYERWPWFRAVIDNAELALARCDLDVARRYVPRHPDPPAAASIWQRLADEHRLALAAVLAIKGETELLEATPWLRRTIRVRTPYIDVLNLIQVELLGRAAGGDDEARTRALRETVHAIAAGLRNTG